MSITAMAVLKGVAAVRTLKELWDEYRMDQADLEALAEELDGLDHEGQSALLMRRSDDLQARADALIERMEGDDA